MEVRDGVRIVDIGPRLQRLMLAVLLGEPGRAVSVGRLTDALWGDEPPAAVQNALHVYVANLRRALEPDRPARARPTVLVTRSPGYCLQVPAHTIDAERFTALVATGREHLAAGDAVGAATVLRQALALWRGAPYADVSDAPFLQLEIARLGELRAGAEESRAEAELLAGAHAAVVADLERLTREQPLRERRWELLALALYRSGRQTEALRVLRQARETLVEELGIEPGTALRRLDQDILEQAPSLDWRPPAPEPVAAVVRRPTHPPSPGPPLVGRDPELSSLRSALADALAGQGRLALVSGEPGIGKTRLAEELSAEAAALGVQVAWGRAPDGEAAPAYWPWVQIVRSLAAEGDAPSVQRALAADAEELARLVPEVAERAGRELAWVAGNLSEAARTRLYDAVVGFLLRLAADRPLLLVVDDLHWADWPTLQLVRLVAERLPAAPVLLVATYREQDAGSSGPVVTTLATLARLPDLLRVRLIGLTEEDIGLLVAHATGRDVNREVAGAIRARTEGNAFFVSELVQLLQSSGQLQAVSGAIPLGVRDVVRQRVAVLPEACRVLLTAAAVAGRTFDLDVVGGAAGFDGERALGLIESALALGVVIEDPAAVGSYRFSHTIVRETIYDGLSALRRSKLHRAIGAAMAADEASADDRSAEIADHFLASSTPADTDDAYRWAVRAAERAALVLAFEKAEALLERALTLAHANRSPEEALRRELAARRRVAGVLLMKHWYGAPEVGEAWASAAETCRGVGDSPDVLPCLWGAWSYRYVRADLSGALDLATDLLARAHRAADVVFEVVGSHCAGITCTHLGRFEEARTHLDRVAARIDEVPSALYQGLVFEPDPRSAHVLFGGVIECLTDGPQGIETLDRALDDARRLGRPLSVVAALVLGALARLLFDDRVGAEKLCAEGAAASDEHGFRLFGTMVGVVRGSAAGDAAAVRQALDEFTRTGARMMLPVFWGLLAEAERAEGRFDQAMAAVDRGLAEAASTGERWWDPELHRLRGELLLGRNRSEAEASLRTGLALARQQGARFLDDRIAGLLQQF